MPELVECELSKALLEAGEDLKGLATALTSAGFRKLSELGESKDEVKEAITEAAPDAPVGEVRRALIVWEKAQSKPEPEPLEPTEPVACELTTALVKAGLKDLAAALTAKAGFRKLSDLGTTEEEVRSAIKEASPKSPAGEVSRVVALWVKAQPKEKRTVLDIPELPEGQEFDLTEPTLTIDDVEYIIPSGLQTDEGTPFDTAADLKNPAWMVIAKRTGLLYGLHAGRVFTRDGAPLGEEPALLWKVPKGSSFLQPTTGSEVASTLSYTSAGSNLAHNRIMDGSLSVGTPFVSASAEVSRKERQAKVQTKKRLYMTGLWRYKHAKLNLQKCTTLSPAFIKRIDAALAQNGDEERFIALDKVFDDFGHVVPKWITLGGQLYFTSCRVTEGHSDEEEVQTRIKAAASAKFEGFSGGASGGGGDATKWTKDYQDIAESVSFSCIGGEISLMSNPAAWASSANNPNRWDVIAREGLEPLIDRMADGTPAGKKRKEEVSAAWEKGLKRYWQGHSRPNDYAKPDFDGRPFSILTAGDSVLAVQPVPIAKRAAALASGTLLADAKAHGLAWELWYSGQTTDGEGRGLPLYYIYEYQTPEQKRVRQQDLDRAKAKNKAIKEATGIPGGELEPSLRVKLTAMNIDGGWRAVCVGIADDPSVPEKDPSTWTLIPADPSSLPGSANASAYVIKNFKTGLLLGPVSGNSPNYVSLVAAPGSKEPHAWLIRTHSLP